MLGNVECGTQSGFAFRPGSAKVEKSRLPVLPPHLIRSFAVLNIVSQPSDRQHFCDRLSRRRMLQIGSIGTFGLTLPNLLKAEQNGLTHPAARSKKSVILVWMHGGPSQLDTFDMKPGAPREYRGPFSPIASSLPGLEVCELLPEHAR